MLEMIDHRWCGQTAVCPAPSGRHILAKLSQSSDVGLVDDGVLPWDRWSTFFAPREGLVDDHAFRYSTRVVAPVEREIGPRAAGAIPKCASLQTRRPASCF